MPILSEMVGQVQQLTIQRPPVNAVDLEAVRGLAAAFQAHDKQRPLVVTAAGATFSAGVDTKAFSGYSKAQRTEFFDAITRMVTAYVAVDAPVVAAVNGHALGGGFVLALCADYRIVAKGPLKFGLTEAKAGVPFPKGPTEVIRHELPMPLLRFMTLSSEVVSADVLLQHQVFDETVPGDELLERARTKAAELASQPAFEAVKRSVRADLRQRLDALV